MTTPAALAPPRAPRSSARLLLDPVVGPFFFGKLLSTAGVWIHNITAAIVVFQLTGSATLVGAVSVAQFAPQLLLTPWSGARADRADRKRQLLAGRLVTAAGSGGLVLWILLVGLSGTAGAAAVIVAAFVVGVGFAVGGPALESLLPSLVRPAELPAAVALNSMPFTLARAAGPAIGALLATLGGPSLAFGVAAASHVVFVVVLLRLQADTGRMAPKDTSIRAGVRHLRTDPAIGALLLGTVAVGVGADPVITLTPSIAESLGAGSQLVGALASSFGVGAASAFLVLGRCRRRFGSPRLTVGGLLLMAGGLTGLSLGSHPSAALLSIGVAGVGMTFALTSLTTQIQQRSPDELRGRIMALWAVAFLGSRPVAAAVNGVTADLVSVDIALLVVVAMVLLGAWLARPARVGR